MILSDNCLCSSHISHCESLWLLLLKYLVSAFWISLSASKSRFSFMWSAVSFFNNIFNFIIFHAHPTIALEVNMQYAVCALKCTRKISFTIMQMCKIVVLSDFCWCAAFFVSQPSVLKLCNASHCLRAVHSSAFLVLFYWCIYHFIQHIVFLKNARCRHAYFNFFQYSCLLGTRHFVQIKITMRPKTILKEDLVLLVLLATHFLICEKHW